MRFLQIRLWWIVMLCICGLPLSAQTLSLNGIVSGNSGMIDSVQIDVYEYNSPIMHYSSDQRGGYTLSIRKGKEYLLVFHRLGYQSVSVSMTDYIENKIANYSLSIHLDEDAHPPDGLYFHDPIKRVAPGSGFLTFTEGKFDLSQIKPRHRADSVSVLINRAQANQYIEVGALPSVDDTRYSAQVAQNIKAEVAHYSQQMISSLSRFNELSKAESVEVNAANITKDEVQLNHLVAAQLALSQRIAAKTDYYLYLQQQHLAQARLYEVEALKYKQQMESAPDSNSRSMIGLIYWRSRAGATNERYLAVDANKRLLLHTHYQQESYQEYIEMLRYRDRKQDTITRPTALTVITTKPKTTEPQPAVDTTDHLAGMKDEARTILIQKAIEEEERFKNYTSRDTIFADLRVRTIHIADDNYEMQVDKKGNTRYLKNNKLITKLTFEFETKRKLVDVLNTIKQVDKFGK